MAKIATGEIDDAPDDDEDPAARALGKKAGNRGVRQYLPPVRP
jgi:hypothetical protein